jgi:hypothetical protein
LAVLRKGKMIAKTPEVVSRLDFGDQRKEIMFP